jgi:CRISPR-associated endonuclease/helicase Cas3
MSSPYLERAANKPPAEFGYEQVKRTFFQQVPEAELDEYFAKAKAEARAILQQIAAHKLPRIAMSLMIKYIFSCLIDADRTNSRLFEEGGAPEETQDTQAFFEKSYARLTAHLDKLAEQADPDNPIPALRAEMSRQCDAFAGRPSGIYTLSVPTGGGKTLASLRYALQHAKTHGKERIIYIVPYTTIIEQNAAEVRRILQDEDMILEHHSNVADVPDPEDDAYNARLRKLRLARDNWDRPIVFTTMVQFLNSFYAKGTRSVRRLHQMSNAVLIFDEVQSVPIRCISLFNAALNFLSTFGRSGILLCTATQPALDYVKHKLLLSDQPEIVQCLGEVEQQFKRVELIDRTTPLGWNAEELEAFAKQQMDEVDQLLVILNTKSAVRKLYDRLELWESVQMGEVKLFHLSTNMCAAHRKDVLDRMRGALKDRERVVCVSTQLIEAGVDISFECVIRSLAGLDSIAQAAGRCNRHGGRPLRHVYIIRSADEELSRLPEIRIGAEKTERVLAEFRSEPERFGGELLSGTAMNLYFHYYYEAIQGELDYPIKELDQKLFDLLDQNRAYQDAYVHTHGQAPKTVNRFSLATADAHFEAISNPAIAVVVPYGEEAENLILTLNGELDIRQLGDHLRQLQQYVVNIYQHELRKLDKNGDIYPLLHGQVLALREVAYSKEFGVESSGEGEWSMAMI